MIKQSQAKATPTEQSEQAGCQNSYFQAEFVAQKSGDDSTKHLAKTEKGNWNKEEF